jgi:hypothetical protein
VRAARTPHPNPLPGCRRGEGTGLRREGIFTSPRLRAKGGAKPRGLGLGGVDPQCRNGGEVGARSAPGEGRWALAVVALLLPLACGYSPTVTPERLKCRDDNGCPSGYRCVGASDTQLGVCCNQPDAAACLPPPDAAPAPGPEAGGKDAVADASSDRATDPWPRDLSPAPDGQPDLAAEASSDLASPLDGAPDVAGMDSPVDSPPPPPDLPTDMPINIDGGPDAPPDLAKDGAIVILVDAPVMDVAVDVGAAIDGSPDSATDAPVTAPQILSIEGTGKTSPIAPRPEGLAFWQSHASDRVAAANRIASSNPVLVVTGSNLDSVTQASLAGQSGQGNHQMSIEEKTMTNLKLRMPSTLTAGGLFVLTLTAASATATAQVFFLQGEKGDPGDSVFTCSGNDCTTTKNLTVSGLFTAAGGFTAGTVSIGPETTRTINVDSSMNADLIQTAIKGIGKHIPSGKTVTIQFADGTYTMNHRLSVAGFYGGGEITLLGNPTQIAADTLRTDQSVYLDFSAQDSDGILIGENGIQVSVDGLKIKVKSDASYHSPIYVMETPYVNVQNCYLLGNSTAQGYGIHASSGAEALVSYTYFSNISYGVASGSGGFIFSSTNDAIDPIPSSGLYAVWGGTITKNGSQPPGEFAASGGEIR